jgi:dynein heavy chain, axonemal
MVQHATESYLASAKPPGLSACDLVLFPTAIAHVARTARALHAPGAAVLLLGDVGTGKRTLAHLAAAAAGFRVRVPVPATGGNSNSGAAARAVRDALAVATRAAVEHSERSCIIIDDAMVAVPAVAEDLTALVAIGEVPGLFAPEDLDALLDTLQSQLASETDLGAGQPDRALPLATAAPRSALCAALIERVEQCVRLVLSVSLAGSGLGVACRHFPALVSRCHIDFHAPWPESALEAAAAHLLTGVDLSLSGTEAAGNPRVPGKGGSIAKGMHQVTLVATAIHADAVSMSSEFACATGRMVYTPPKLYLDMLSLFKTMLSQKQAVLIGRRECTETGLHKLKEAQEAVVAMEADVAALQPVLAERAVASEVLVAEVTQAEERSRRIQSAVAEEEAAVQQHTTYVQVPPLAHAVTGAHSALSGPAGADAYPSRPPIGSRFCFGFLQHVAE